MSATDWGTWLMGRGTDVVDAVQSVILEYMPAVESDPERAETEAQLAMAQLLQVRNGAEAMQRRSLSARGAAELAEMEEEWKVLAAPVFAEIEAPELGGLGLAPLAILGYSITAAAVAWLLGTAIQRDALVARMDAFKEQVAACERLASEGHPVPDGLCKPRSEESGAPISPMAAGAMAATVLAMFALTSRRP